MTTNDSGGLGRYVSPRMQELWSERQQYATWARVEMEAAKAQGAPPHVVEVLKEAKTPSVGAVHAAEVVTKHDVVAFLRAWRQEIDITARDMAVEVATDGSKLAADAKRWSHRNMTSSDLVDTANAVRLAAAAHLIYDAAINLRAAMAKHALAHWHTRRVARTHGQTAEESTWGYRVADLTMTLDRAISVFSMARESVRIGKLSGPVGDYKRVSRNAEGRMCQALGLEVPIAATQVLGRDNYVEFVSACAALCTAVEAGAVEVRLSSRTDTGEVAEAFGVGQRGSSAMPHKRNPISAENLTGVARLVRAQVSAFAEGVALHHERDISHSVVERVLLPMVTGMTEYAMLRANKMWTELSVDTARMRDHLQEAGDVLWTAQATQTLIDQDVDPDEAWRRVADGKGPAPHEIEWPHPNRLAYVRAVMVELVSAV